MRRERYLHRVTMLLFMVLAGLGAHSSAPQVKFAGFLEFTAAIPGQLVHVVFEANLPNGYHVNSNAPLEEFLKPTRLLLEAPKGVNIGEIVYPEPLLFKTRFSDEPLAVYEHRFLIGATLDLAEDIEHGDHPLKATLKYQACTERVCYPPATRTAEITLRVGAEAVSADPAHVGLFDAIEFGTQLSIDRFSDHQ